MFCEHVLSLVSFAALVALERPLSRVHPHVSLQMAKSSGSEVALVTLVWLFSCVLSYHVSFQFISSNAGILTHYASLRLFTASNYSTYVVEGQSH